MSTPRRRSLSATLTALCVVIGLHSPSAAWAATGSTRGLLNIVFLIALIIALVTFLTQVVLSLVEVSSPSESVIKGKRAAGWSNIFFGLAFTIYLIVAREGLSSWDSFLVTAFFGLGLAFVGTIGVWGSYWRRGDT